METQIVEKAEIKPMISLDIKGLPRINVTDFRKTKDCPSFISVRIGSDVSIFFESEQHFKAFVGEMTKAVASLGK